MNMPKKTTVTLEDLLRVKRAERPPPEFWAQFERELRTKQLAAIVEPRPWWAPLIRFGTRAARYQLPVGAAAVLALSFVTVRQYRGDDYEAVVASPSIAAIGEPAPAASVGPDREAAPLRAPVAAERATVAAATVSDVAVTGRSSHTIPLPTVTPAVSEPTPSARYIAANLAAAQADNPNLVNAVFGSMMRSADNREPVRDPLAQISAPGESRRSRLLASALGVAAPGDLAAPSADRVSRRLTEERLYDSISRIGVQGDRVAIKF